MIRRRRRIAAAIGLSSCPLCEMYGNPPEPTPTGDPILDRLLADERTAAEQTESVRTEP